MNGLRTPILRRTIACLALAGLLLPLAPAASARGVAQDVLTDALGHREAVELALTASKNAADPEKAFLTTYFDVTGLDADEVLALLDGQPLWLLTEPFSPLAVIVSGSSSSATSGAASGAAVLPSLASGVAQSACSGVDNVAPEARVSSSPQALQPRGP